MAPGPTPGAATSGPAPDSADTDLHRYVPPALLQKLREADASGAMRGERRTVTMLFADLVGSTAAAEHLDPEEWADIANGAFEHLIAPVYRYEGTLARLQGDAILAFFGAPVAHEDDPVRAVHAALEMLEAIVGYAEQVRRTAGVPVAARVGINTGLVVVGEVGSDLRVEYTALGDAINVAARMEQTAEPGSVRITAHTADLLGGAFDTTEIGPVDVKGKGAPVVAVRVDGVAAVPVQQAVATRLVGRDAELAVLEGAFDRLRSGVGGIVTIVGDAGIGKSGVLAASAAALASRVALARESDEDGEIGWLQGRCRSFDTAIPYAPFRDLADRWLQLGVVPPDAVYERIARSVERVHGGPDPDTAAYLAHVHGAPLPETQAALVAAIDTAPLHAKTTAAIVGYLEGEARLRPIVLALEDLHWADAVSLALTELLIAATERSPILLIGTLRPVRDGPVWRLVEFSAREAAPRHDHVELAPLDDGAVAAMLDALLGPDGATTEERERVRARAEGNPLFLEELAGAIGGDGHSVPASLTGLLTARLDRLDHRSRRVADVASTIGFEFDLRALEHLVDGEDVATAMRELVRSGAVVEQRRRPYPMYAFRHALLHEAAYDTVLRKDRREVHGRLARYLGAARPEVPAEVARHHLASDHPEDALPWLVDAGERATRVMAVFEAIRQFTAALELATDDTDPELVARAHLGKGEAYSLVPDLDQASKAYQTLVEYGQACELPPMQVKALNQLGMNAAMLAADFGAAERYLEQARAIADEADDQIGLAEYHMNSCFVAAAQGNVDRAIHHDVEAVRIGGETQQDKVRVLGMIRRTFNLLARGDLAEATAVLDEARHAADEVGSEYLVALLEATGESMLRTGTGELRAARELLRSSAATLARYGAYETPIALQHAAQVALGLGAPEEALMLLVDTRRQAEQSASQLTLSNVEATAALVYATLGDVDSSLHHRTLALEHLTVPLGDFQASTVWADLAQAQIQLARWHEARADAALGLEASGSTRFWERPRLLGTLALGAAHLGDVDQARGLVAEASEYIAIRGMALHEPLLAIVAGVCAQLDGDLRDAEVQLARADDSATAMGMRLVACDVAALRAEIATVTARPEDAADHQARQERVAAELLAEVMDPRLRELLDVRLRAGWALEGGRSSG